MDKTTKWILIFMGIVLVLTMICAKVFADDRTNLQEEAQQLQQQRQRYIQAVNQIDMRLMEIKGVLDYLKSKEVKKEK